MKKATGRETRPETWNVFRHPGLTYGHIDSILKDDLGFRRTLFVDRVVYRNRGSLSVVLPRYLPNRIAMEHHVVSVSHYLIFNGIVSTEAWEGLVRKALGGMRVRLIPLGAREGGIRW